MTWARTILLAVLAGALGACGDDSESGGSGGSGGSAGNGGSAGSGATGGGSGATGGSAGSTGGSAGSTGGSAGSAGAPVDPIAGIDPVAEAAGGFAFTEGPVWFEASGKLYFSDIPPGRIHELTPPSTVVVFREPSGNSNGLGIDHNGLLVACEHSGRRVSRTLQSGTVQTIVDAYQGNALNSPNDVIVRSDGNLYFTDPTYGGNPNEIGFQGVFRVDPSGAISLVADDMTAPNGIALSPDESVLYVTDSEDDYLRHYTVASDGTVSGGQKLADTANTPDGMAVDVAGHLYVATAAGIEVYKSDGMLHGTIGVPEQPSNCTFGGADKKTLYITARTSLYGVELNLPGLP
jgi:gluconolactonase